VYFSATGRGIILDNAVRLGRFLKAVSASLPEFKIVCEGREATPYVVALTEGADEVLESCFEDTSEEIAWQSSGEALVEYVMRRGGISRADIWAQIEHPTGLLDDLGAEEFEAVKAYLEPRMTPPTSDLPPGLG